jgi:Na+/H+ antiporter NhaC
MDSPSSFWWNLGAGVLIGAALLDWWHVDDLDYALVSVFALLFVAIAYGTRRSSWAVLATIGLFLAGYHFAKEWSSETVSVTGVTNVRDWVPYAVFAFVGFLLVALGLKKRGVAAGEPERFEEADTPRYD